MVAVCVGAAGAVLSGARAVCTGAGAETVGLAGEVATTFFAGSVDVAGAAACGRDSTGALGIGALPASGNVVAEVLLVVVASATVASDFTVVALALDSVAGLFGDEVTRSSTSAPPTTTAMITPNAMPK